MKKKVKLTCIIDDDKIHVHLIKKVIEIKQLSEGLLVFRNGMEALNHFKQISNSPNPDSPVEEQRLPDIIFLDLHMPIMGGWEFLNEFMKIRNNFEKKISVYVVSSSIDPQDLERAKSFEMVTDYLIKPIALKKFEKIFNKNTAA
jgi:CheY-like chemotaxis protein